MREVKGHIALERVLPPSSPDVLRSISPSQPRRLVCMALPLRLGARLGVTRSSRQDLLAGRTRLQASLTFSAPGDYKQYVSRHRKEVSHETDFSDDSRPHDILPGRLYRQQLYV